MTAPWLILRCSGCKTLDLVASLNDAGFEAWSPVETVRVLKADRRKLAVDKFTEVRKPLLGGYVFARADRLQDLLELSHSPSLNYRVWDSALRRMVTRGHPYFTMFRDLGEIATVPAEQLEPLRAIERRRKPRGIVKAVAPGTAVRLSEGGFAGMDGIVDSVRGKQAMVVFADFPFPVEIPCWLLNEQLDVRASVNVSTASSERAARAA